MILTSSAKSEEWVDFPQITRSLIIFGCAAVWKDITLANSWFLSRQLCIAAAAITLLPYVT